MNIPRSAGKMMRALFPMLCLFILVGLMIGLSADVSSHQNLPTKIDGGPGFVVNTTTDTQDAIPGNGICADAGGMCSLRAAITEANALAGPDVITLAAGTYTETLAGANENANAGGDFDITSAITINGASSATTIVQSNAAPMVATERVFHIVGAGATAVVINGVTIRNGHAVFGPGAGGDGGGGVRVETGTSNLTLNNSTVTGNWSDSRGGGIQVATQPAGLTLTNCTVSNNRVGSDVAGSEARGGGLDVFGTAAAPGSTVNITNSLFDGNTANTSVNNSFGAGMALIQTNATANVMNSTFSNNASSTTSSGSLAFAGGIYNINATLNLTNSVVTGNMSQDHAGIRIIASTIGPTVTNVINTTVSNNRATDQGGGITQFATATNDATLTIKGSTISGNMVTNTDGAFGAVLNSNSAGTVGHAILLMTNSTVSGNVAPDFAGIYNVGDNGTVIVEFSTIAGNIANNIVFPPATCGGLCQDATGSLFIQNTVVADNVAESSPDIFGTISSFDYNHIENISDGTFAPSAHDVTGTDPQLGPLANNGGLTLTHLPGPASPVLDTIPNNTNGCGDMVNTDQRGSARPAGGGCDKGSVEVIAGTPTNTPTGSPTPTPSVTPTPTATATATATGSPMPTPFTISPSNRDFGVLAIRTNSAPIRFTVTNRAGLATSNMTYALSVPDGSSFSITLVTCGSFISANSSCTLDVRFTPSTIGPKSATLTVTSTTVAGSAVAVLTGTAIAKSAFDYDFDGKSDISIFRPTTGEWYLQRSTAGLFGMSFGVAGDRPLPADYDGDGKADIAIYRPSEGLWAILNSSSQTLSYYLFGYEDDLPVPADYTGDGRADICVFRPSTGLWYWRNSTTGMFSAVQFGAAGDRPTIGDFDADGKADVAVFHPSSGVWYHLLSSNGQPYGERFGIATDVLVPADYDGDGRTDLAVYRPSTGIWYLRISSTGMWSYRIFGLSDDIPAPGDYDGDGKADVCVFRPSEGNWYWQKSSDGSFNGYHFGINGDKPTQAAFVY